MRIIAAGVGGAPGVCGGVSEYVQHQGPELPPLRGASESTSVEVDPRAAFLLVAAVHHDQFHSGAQSIDTAFDAVADWLDRLFPCDCARDIAERLERCRPQTMRVPA